MNTHITRISQAERALRELRTLEKGGTALNAREFVLILIDRGMGNNEARTAVMQLLEEGRVYLDCSNLIHTR